MWSHNILNGILEPCWLDLGKPKKEKMQKKLKRSLKGSWNDTASLHSVTGLSSATVRVVMGTCVRNIFLILASL